MNLLPRHLCATQAINQAVAASRSLPGLVANLRTVDPALASQLEDKPLLACRSPWGPLAVAAAMFLSARYGLGWDADTASLMGGLGCLLGGYLARCFTRGPVAGFARRCDHWLCRDTNPLP